MKYIGLKLALCETMRWYIKAQICEIRPQHQQREESLMVLRPTAGGVKGQHHVL